METELMVFKFGEIGGKTVILPLHEGRCPEPQPKLVKPVVTGNHLLLPPGRKIPWVPAANIGW